MKSADRVLREACGTEFTAAVARVERRGRPVFERAYGATRDDERARPVFADTLFDLASLTKLFVSTLVLELVAAGRLELDAPLTGALPEWIGTPHAAITARMLLSHTSGMNSGADYRAILDENVESFALRAPLLARPGERVIYSDLGFIALGTVLERTAGRSLAALVAQRFPSSVRYRPAATLRSQIPATEDDGWRGRVQGFVHDEKAHLMGGVAGHAGLFGTAADVGALTEIYLGTLHGRGRYAIGERLVREAVTERAYDPVLRRGLGWALKTSDENSCGAHMDAATFGHTGFVGTSVWADPARDLQGVLLTNAVYFGRNDIRDLRARFYDAIVAEHGA
ncbi:MAG TPA: serine hydrolase domain-containing protein [Candidatus Binatia bacterium]|nr:serine hydrolase domain-containing protein [Candidatus Binatia bacterium]